MAPRSRLFQCAGPASATVTCATARAMIVATAPVRSERLSARHTPGVASTVDQDPASRAFSSVTTSPASTGTPVTTAAIIRASAFIVLRSA